MALFFEGILQDEELRGAIWFRESKAWTTPWVMAFSWDFGPKRWKCPRWLYLVHLNTTERAKQVWGVSLAMNKVCTSSWPLLCLIFIMDISTSWAWSFNSKPLLKEFSMLHFPWIQSILRNSSSGSGQWHHFLEVTASIFLLPFYHSQLLCALPLKPNNQAIYTLPSDPSHKSLHHSVKRKYYRGIKHKKKHKYGIFVSWMQGWH